MKSHSANVLVVDDDEVDRLAIVRCLRKHGFGGKVHESRDGHEALAILRGDGGKRLEPPYIVLLDLCMPRMDGVEFLEEIRRSEGLESTVVFVLTTSRAPSDLARCYEHKVAGYIVKSASPEVFLKTMNMIKTYCETNEFPT